jgi:hypothetical protein
MAIGRKRSSRSPADIDLFYKLSVAGGFFRHIRPLKRCVQNLSGARRPGSVPHFCLNTTDFKFAAGRRMAAAHYFVAGPLPPPFSCAA